MYVAGNRPWFKSWPAGVPQHIDYPEIPLFESLSNTAGKYPDNIAFSQQEKSLTYAELDRATSQLAACLYEQGISKGDRVAILLPNSPEFIIGYYGTAKAGAIASPVNPLYKGAELRRQLDDAGALAIITGSDFHALIKDIKDGTRLKSIILTDAAGTDGAISLQDVLKNYSPDPPVLDLKPKEDVAAIEYTGGTTGFQPSTDAFFLPVLKIFKIYTRYCLSGFEGN